MVVELVISALASIEKLGSRFWAGAKLSFGSLSATIEAEAGMDIARVAAATAARITSLLIIENPRLRSPAISNRVEGRRVNDLLMVLQCVKMPIAPNIITSRGAHS